MVTIVKTYKRNTEGEQWYDTEVFYTELDAVSYVNQKVEEHIEDGFELRKEEKHHRYLVDEEGNEEEYVIQEKEIRGKSPLTFHEDIRQGVQEAVPNGWQAEWEDYGVGQGSIFVLSKRFRSQSEENYLIHMDLSSMRMFYVVDETRKYNEDRGSFDCSPIWEPNEILLVTYKGQSIQVMDKAFKDYGHLISPSDKNEIIETYQIASDVWNKKYYKTGEE